MKLIDILERDCNKLTLALNDCIYATDQIQKKFAKEIKTALFTKEYYRILPYSDFNWGASCHGNIPYDLVKFVPKELVRREGKNSFVDSNYVLPNSKRFSLHDLMAKTETFASEGAHLYLTETFRSIYYIQKIPWTWLMLGKLINKKHKELPASLKDVSNTLIYFRELPASFKNIDIKESVSYPDLLTYLDAKFAVTIMKIPSIKSTLFLLSHFLIGY
ncbi:MAG: hypothetical protein AAFQ80_15185 [Cyanobacteria bacterium J06621_8]